MANYLKFRDEKGGTRKTYLKYIASGEKEANPRKGIEIHFPSSYLFSFTCLRKKLILGRGLKCKGKACYDLLRIKVRKKLILGRGLKHFALALFAEHCQVCENEANPQKGIETPHPAPGR